VPSDKVPYGQAHHKLLKNFVNTANFPIQGQKLIQDELPSSKVPYGQNHYQVNFDSVIIFTVCEAGFQDLCSHSSLSNLGTAADSK
jgi:hypothetical protein